MELLVFIFVVVVVAVLIMGAVNRIDVFSPHQNLIGALVLIIAAVVIAQQAKIL